MHWLCHLDGFVIAEKLIQNLAVRCHMAFRCYLPLLSTSSAGASRRVKDVNY